MRNGIIKRTTRELYQKGPFYLGTCFGQENHSVYTWSINMNRENQTQI